jgi:hypothetical protein
MIKVSVAGNFRVETKVRNMDYVAHGVDMESAIRRLYSMVNAFCQTVDGDKSDIIACMEEINKCYP